LLKKNSQQAGNPPPAGGGKAARRRPSFNHCVLEGKRQFLTHLNRIRATLFLKLKSTSSFCFKRQIKRTNRATAAIQKK
jgi:hypothetical protein